ncbi:ABC transporter ATP-binding protein [Streptomyces sp. NPDC002537]
MSGLSIQRLFASHGREEVLRGVDLTVADGTLACVLGPSGCGKSTLLRTIAGFHPAHRGQVTVRGHVLDDGTRRVAPERRRIGYVPQDGALFPHLTVEANIGFGLPRRRRRERVAQLLALVGLDGFERRHPHQLSGGQQQRVALARALAPDPELLLLDEPFAALDAALRTDVRAEVAAVLRQTGATAILVTHDQDEAMSFADTLAVMRDGRITQTGTPQDLYHRPVDTTVARLLGEANVIPADFDGDRAATAFGPLPCTTAPPPTGTRHVMLRPRQLRLADAPGRPGSVPARVLRHDFRGHDHRLELAPDPDPGHDPGPGLPGTLVAYVDTVPPDVASTVHIEVSGAAHPVAEPDRTPAAEPDSLVHAE